MINSVFISIAEELNQFFSTRFSLSEEKVIISALPDTSNTNAAVQNDNLVISLINVEQEKIHQKNMANLDNRPVNLYVYLLFAAGFSDNNYEEALKLLSATIGFFQQRPVFNHENTPGLHPEIDKLCFEMVNLNIQELSQLWGVQGGKYYPSVVYRARLITIRDNNLIDGGLRMTGFGSEVNQ